MNALEWLREPGQQTVRPVYAVFGDDSYLIRESIRAVVRAVLPRDESEHLTRVLRLTTGDTVAVFDGRRRPYGSHELVSRYEVAGSSDQHVENLEGARADRDRYEFTGCVAPAQRAGLPVEPEALEQEDVTASKRVHASSRPRMF